jgi:hypothetical protein
MSRLALALLLALPVAAGAQVLVPYPPGYRIPPPPPPPPPAYVGPYVAPQVPPLSPFYFNLGIGYGAQSWYGSPGYGGYAGVAHGGLAYHVGAGARLMPQLLLGFDLTGLSTFGSDPYVGNVGLTVLDYDVVATLFPFVRGFFLRGGAGLSTLAWAPPTGIGVSYLGTNVLLGAGWAFPVSSPLHFTLGVDWILPFFGAADVSGSSIWMFRAGLGLY